MSAGAVTGILLAAGQARRFGANKLLATLADGSPVALATLARLRAAVDRVVIVTPAEGATADRFEDEGLAPVRCADAAAGMAHSLRCGIAASADSSAWLVMLADMPYVRTETLQKIVQTLRQGAAIVVPRHAGRNGHPVAFTARFRAELQTLTGDRGARAILDAHPESVQYLDVDDPGIHQDIDTPADLQ